MWGVLARGKGVVCVSGLVPVWAGQSTYFVVLGGPMGFDSCRTHLALLTPTCCGTVWLFCSQFMAEYLLLLCWVCISVTLLTVFALSGHRASCSCFVC